ncbi:MAG: ABC transporter permease [Planctomycetota bacterium]|nr:ABC transporter permease [Planctomycetota bacterium]
MTFLSGLLAFADQVGYQVRLFFLVLHRLPHLLKRRAQLASQLYGAGNKVLHVVVLVSFVMGMVISLQTGLVLAEYGQQDQIGIVVAITMAREMGPFITAVILAATVGSALAAELGTMAVSDELAALEVLSVDRTSYLTMPRVVAMTIMAPILTIFADAIGVIGGGFVARSQLGVGRVLYYDSAIEALQAPAALIALPKDVYGGLFKAAIFGCIIAVISCSSGLRARGGALGVGNATRSAVRDSIIAIIITNYFLSWLFYQA